MQVRDGFAGMRPVVDDEAKTMGELEFFRDLPGDEQEVSEDGLVVGGGLADARNDFLRHDQQVHRGLRLDVVENDAMLILVFDLGGDFPVDDFLKDGFAHEFSPRITRA